MASSCLASSATAGAALCGRPRRRVACSAADAGGNGDGGRGAEPAWFLAGRKNAGRLACGVLAAWAVASASNPVIAASQRLPPLSTEPNRCERAFVGNTIGQANGVYDKPLDLRFCDYSNEKINLKGKSLAAALMSDAKFDGADMSEVVMSKAYAVGASFKGTDFTNAVIDRVNFEKADLTGAIFKNTVLSGSTFNDGPPPPPSPPSRPRPPPRLAPAAPLLQETPCPSAQCPPPPLLRALPHAATRTRPSRTLRAAMMPTPTSSRKTKKAARRRDGEESMEPALVNSKDSGESDLQENTNPTHQGRSKKKESAKKKERGKKRTSSALDSTNDTANVENSEYNLDEPTMEERLATLNLINQDNQKNGNEEQSLSLAPPSADSVHILLKQALRADDSASLLTCLYNRDEQVIVKSISLLKPADVVKLLKFFVVQIQSRGAVLVCLLPWLQTLLNRHMSSIVSQESSLSLLNSLYQLIDARTSTFKSALQLSTTLDYFFSEIADDEADEEEIAPPIIYEDKDTDEEESEDDAMETDGEAEELGDVTDASEHSDGSEIMSD